MKAFKGCTNPACVAYVKKVHYKKSDSYCPKCGNELSFVCADCWKALGDDNERYCISCLSKREQDKEQRKAAIKDAGTKAGAVVAASAGAVVAFVNKGDKIIGAAEKAAKVVGKVAEKVVK